MIPKTMYMCEHCLSTYDDEKEALVCENKHPIPVRIHATIFKKTDICPDSINILMSDSSIWEYRRYGPRGKLP